jgi:aminoglycoside phosphotransferase
MEPAGDPRTRVPVPYDLYRLEEPIDPDAPLSAFQEAFILSALPAGTRLLEARFAREEWLPCPMRVRVATPDGVEQTLFLWMDRKLGGVETEARLLPVLGRLGLPVPTLLAGPVVDPDRPNLGAQCLLSLLPGRDLLTSSWSASPAVVDWAGGLLLEGVARLHELTEAVSRDAVARHLPRRTLQAELEAVIERGGAWMEEPVFDEAVRSLMPHVEAIDTPLVFSNGDYNPGNFLSDGKGLTGFVDFSWACFEDPHVGFAKCWIYDFFPFNKAGLVERYLDRQSLTRAEFAPRVALRCLWTLQREIAVAGGDTGYRDHVLRLLGEAIAAPGARSPSL